MNKLILPLLLVILLSLSTPKAVEAAKINIRGIDGALKENVEAFIAGVTETENAGSGKYQHQLRKKVGEALQPLGYYEPNITVKIQPLEKETLVDIDVEAGSPVRLESLEISLQGDALTDDAFQILLSDQGLKKGTVFHQGAYEDFKLAMSNLALSRGYFDALWSDARVEVHVKERRAEATLIFDSGRRYRFGDSTITGAPDLVDLIQATRPFTPGDYYLAENVAKYNSALGDSNYFRSVLVLPEIEKRDNGFVPINIRAIPKADNIVSVGGGYATDVGVRGKLKWTIPRINRAGHSVLSRVHVSSPEQNISTTYKIPIEDITDNFALAQIGFQRKNSEDTESRKYTLQAKRQWKQDNKWVRSLFLRYEAEDFRQGQQRDYSSLILPGISYTRDRVKGGLNVTWGDRLQFFLELSDPIWGSDARLAKIHTLGKWVRTAGESNAHKLILRADLGAILVEDIADVPASLRFFAGGGQSIRGFSYESIAPQDAQGLLIGGRYLTVGTLEYSYRIFEKWRLAGFVDLGTATNDFSEPVSIGTGTGLRWITPVGPIRLDLAIAISEPGKPWMIHFSMGPDL